MAERNGDDHGGGHRGDVTIEQVCAHAGDITHVIAHIIRDDGRISRIVFRDAQLNLTREIGRDVGRFGEDAAARFVQTAPESLRRS